MTHPAPRPVNRAVTVLALLLASVLAVAETTDARPDNPRDGQLHRSQSGTEVWDERARAWVDPESFWLAYAEQGSGRFWGRRDSYPPYGDVAEHDTLLIEGDAGVCLMYFFHSRWRRAQDVRRWDPGFNEIGGCPSVFD